jgi:hypothetical protein
VGIEIKTTKGDRKGLRLKEWAILLRATMKSRSFVLCLLVVISAVAQRAMGGAIPITDAGFETLQTSATDPTPFTLGSGDFTGGFGNTAVYHVNGSQYAAAFVPGWISSGGDQDVGVFNPTGQGILSGQGGNNTAFVNGITGEPNSISQSLPATLEPGTYVLSVSVGHRSDLADPQPVIQLDGAGTATFSSSPVVPPGSFATFTHTYVIDPGNPGLNLPLGITLGNAVNAQNAQINFDDVSLDFTPLPEPATMGWIGIVAAVVIRWRSRGNLGMR